MGLRRTLAIGGQALRKDKYFYFSEVQVSIISSEKHIKNLIIYILLGVSAVFGQTRSTPVLNGKETQSSSQPAAPTEELFDEAIEDNSFFIEEAFNQEPGVVQHISTGTYFRSPQRSFFYSLTQEWPVGSQTHQFSFTLPYEFIDGGISDILLNYRLQVWDQSHWAAFSPRLSVILPTGNVDKGLGNGVTGLQVNLPVSKRVSNSFFVHFNAGSTLLPGVKQTLASGEEVKNNLLSYNMGGSVIWLATKNLNLLVEYVKNFVTEIDNNGNKANGEETIVSPGIRYAIDIGDLQIVPGIAFAFTSTSSGAYNGTFFYLSFEHPF